MIIQRLRLEGYRFFKLKNYQVVDYRPDKQIQVIVGTSGSGKSSLIKQLSPLPAAHEEFYRPGKKEIWISHNNKDYYLASVFTEDRNMYIFEVDGENLNKGMTITVYRELVEAHFAYRADIHDIVTGLVCFHDMKANERRALFMRMNHDDFTYAVTAFKKIKERIKDYQVLLKQLQIRLGSEIDKILPSEKVDEVKQEIEAEQVILRELLNHRRNNIATNTNIAIDSDNRLIAAMESLKGTLALISENKSLRTPECIESRLSVIQTKVTQLEAEFNSRCESANKIRSILQQVSQNASVDLETVLKDLDTLQQQESHLVSSFKFKTPISQPEDAETALNKAYDAIQHYVKLLSDLYRKHPDKRAWLNSEWVLLIEQIETGKAALNACDASLKELDTKITTLVENSKKENTECPSCHYTWKVNYSEEEHQRLCRLKENTEQRRVEVNKKLETLLAFKADFDIYWQCLEFASSFYNTPALRLSLAEIDTTTRYIQDPDAFSHSLEFLRQDIQLQKELNKLRHKKETLLGLKKTLTDIAKVNRQGLEDNLTTENQAIQRVQEAILPFLEERKALQREQSLIKTIHTQFTVFNEMYRSRQRFFADDIEVHLRRIENEVIHHLQLSITAKDRMLSQAAMQQQNIASLNAEIQLIQMKLNLLKLAAKELSPTEGLIAKGMTSFINCFVESLNRFIARFWLYPMEIIPIKVKSDEDFDLDYKFAVSINGDSDNPTPDISVGSSGMKESINIAFVAVIMEYLGLHGYPIFLDEFAVKMDEAHRKSAYQIIEQLTEILGISQVFVVSHYENAYGSLANSDLNVLCDANITIPSHLTYNTCLSLQ